MCAAVDVAASFRLDEPLCVPRPLLVSARHRRHSDVRRPALGGGRPWGSGRIVSHVQGALAEIRLIELSELLRKAVALFPGEVVPLEPDAVDRVIDSWDDAVLARLAALDRRVWNVRDVDEHLIDYLRRNQRDVLRPERGVPD